MACQHPPQGGSPVDTIQKTRGREVSSFFFMLARGLPSLPTPSVRSWFGCNSPSYPSSNNRLSPPFFKKEHTHTHRIFRAVCGPCTVKKTPHIRKKERERERGFLFLHSWSLFGKTGAHRVGILVQFEITEGRVEKEISY